jgi:hypothetical protein
MKLIPYHGIRKIVEAAHLQEIEDEKICATLS